MSTSNYSTSVFVNCPYDRQYGELFEAIIFAVYDCGYLPRCAVEIDNAANDRLEKIIEIMRGCKFGIHDLSRTSLDSRTKLPRFNMPFELGMFLAIEAMERRRQKVALILEQKRGRYRKFLSDVAGRDAKAHGGRCHKSVCIVRDWLRANRKGVRIPSGQHVWKRFQDFQRELPEICKDAKLSRKRLIYDDYRLVVEEWLGEHDF